GDADVSAVDDDQRRADLDGELDVRAQAPHVVEGAGAEDEERTAEEDRQAEGRAVEAPGGEEDEDDQRERAEDREAAEARGDAPVAVPFVGHVDGAEREGGAPGQGHQRRARDRGGHRPEDEDGHDRTSFSASSAILSAAPASAHAASARPAAFRRSSSSRSA